MANDIFVNEDLSKPENRINLSLFGLLPSSVFRSWFLGRLNLPEDAVLYPSVNVVSETGSIRPDFVIKHGCTEETLGWLEVECGRDVSSLSVFERSSPSQSWLSGGDPTPRPTYPLRRSPTL